MAGFKNSSRSSETKIRTQVKFIGTWMFTVLQKRHKH